MCFQLSSREHTIVKYCSLVVCVIMYASFIKERQTTTCSTYLKAQRLKLYNTSRVIKKTVYYIISTTTWPPSVCSYLDWQY